MRKKTPEKIMSFSKKLDLPDKFIFSTLLQHILPLNH